jgi:hypothetical protein
LQPQAVNEEIRPTTIEKEENVDGDDISEEIKTLQKLPNAHRIEEMIKKFKLFNLSLYLPPNLSYSKTPDDISLESNITKLFSDDVVCNKMQLIDALQRVVSYEDNLMSDAAKKKHRSAMKSFTKQQRDDVKKFYPCLISLIDAILTRCDSDPQSQLSGQSAQVRKIVLDIWRGVMSDLGEIFAVIVYGKDKNLLDLGTFPTDLKQIVNERNKKISAITNAAREIENEKLLLKQTLNERDRQFEGLTAKFANQASQIKLDDAKSMGLKYRLDSVTKTGPMVIENLKRIEAINDLM